MNIFNRPKINILEILNYLAIFTIFAESLNLQINAALEFRASFIILIAILLALLPFLRKISFSRYFFWIFSILIATSIWNIFKGRNDIFLLSKQIIGIFTNAILFYLLIKINKEDIKKIFAIYLNIAFVIALIGIIQTLAYQLKLTAFYDFSFFLPKWQASFSQGYSYLRINSILPEPASFCLTMLPAFFVSFASLFLKKLRIINTFKSIIITASFFLTFSLLGYIGIILTIGLLLKFLKRQYIIMGSVAIALIVIFSYSLVPEFKTKAKQTFQVATGQIRTEEVNLSTFTLMTNAKVAWRTFKENPLFGNGLGSHEISYKKLVHSIIDTRICYLTALLNSKDANSLFLRLLSETGVLGLSLFFIFLITNYIFRENKSASHLWLINNAVLILMLMRLARQGHYFSDGFFLFFWLYYFTKKAQNSTEPVKQKINILIDFTQIPVQKCGVGVYAFNLVKKIYEHDKTNAYLIILQDDDNSLDFIQNTRFKMLKVNSHIFRNLPARFIMEQFYLPFLTIKNRIDIIHSLHYSFPLFAPTKRIVTICDMTFFKFPKMHIFIKTAYFRFFIILANMFADEITTISQATLNDFRAQFPKWKERGKVIYLGKDDSFNPHTDTAKVEAVKKTLNIKSSYLLFLGTIEPRKNIKNLILAFSKLTQENQEYQLVIAGKRGWHYDETFKLVDNLQIRERVIFIGFIDEKTKPYLIKGAKIFVYPSIYEGFGIPILEAMSCGVPVVTSPVSSLPEVAGSAALYANPDNPDDIYAKIKLILDDDNLWTEMAKKSVIQAEKFNWDITACETIKLYNRLGSTQ